MTIPDHILREAIQAERARRIRAARIRSDHVRWCEHGPKTLRGAMVLHGWQIDASGHMEASIRRLVARRLGAPKVVRIATYAAPQQSGKSEIVKRMAARAIANGLSVGVLTYNDPFAREWGRDIRRLLRHETTLEAYPHLRPPDGQDAESKRRRAEQGNALTQLTVPHPDPDRPPVRFVASGRRGGIEGLPLDIVIPDDLYKTISDAQSPATNKLVNDLLESSAWGRVSEYGGEIWDIGTPRGKKDTKGFWRSKRKKVEAAGETLPLTEHSYPLRGSEPWRYGPRGYITANWDESKERIARAFLGRYAGPLLDCTEIEDVGGLIPAEALAGRYPEHPEIARASASEVWVSMDSAETDGDGDWTSIGTYAIRDTYADKVHGIRGQFGPEEVIRQLVDEVRRVRPRYTLIEYTSSGKMAALVIENNPELRRLTQVVRVTPAGRKRDRIVGAIPAMISSVRYPNPGPDTAWCYGTDEHGLDYFQRLRKLRGDRPDMRGEVDDEADELVQVVQRLLESAPVDTGDYWAALSGLGV